jgi:N-methylhydantoinase A
LPTVTDAHVVLGHFPGDVLLDGEFKLDVVRARKSLDALAADMSKAAARKISAIEAARGGAQRGDRKHGTRAQTHFGRTRGHDPRDFALLPFGRRRADSTPSIWRARLRIPRVLVPRSPGALSALGVLEADVVKGTKPHSDD